MQSMQNKEEPSFDRRKIPKVSKHWICLRKSRGEQKVPAKDKKHSKKKGGISHVKQKTNP